MKANAARWTRLLRLLDALNQGENNAEIAGLLFNGDEKKLEEERRYAVGLVNGGYLEMLRIPNA